MNLVRTFLFALFFCAGLYLPAFADLLPFPGPSGNVDNGSGSWLLTLVGFVGHLIEAVGFVCAVKVLPLGLVLWLLRERRVLAAAFLSFGLALGILGYLAPVFLESYLASQSEGSHFQ